MNDHFGLPRFFVRSCSNVPSRSQRSRISSSSAFESGSEGRGVNMPSIVWMGCATLGSGNNQPARLVEPLDSHVSALERKFMPVEATNATFDSEVLETDGKVIVDFWAEWCG